ncbi:MAG: hypothetical protein IPH20_20465 [Bacteroidales bacterium]|nr:hypothetical protein [Bacteroidales bacterium]
MACTNSVVGTYTFTIIDGTTLNFTLVEDACTGRANSLTEGPFYRMSPKPSIFRLISYSTGYCGCRQYGYCSG